MSQEKEAIANATSMKGYFFLLRDSKKTNITVVLSAITEEPFQDIQGAKTTSGFTRQVTKTYSKVLAVYNDAVLFSVNGGEALVPYSSIIEVQVPTQ